MGVSFILCMRFAVRREYLFERFAFDASEARGRFFSMIIPAMTAAAD